jgi:anti-sigma factor RsiW
MQKSGWYRIAMTGAMVVVLLNTYLAVRALHSFFNAQGWRAHTLEVLTHTKALELGVSNGNNAVPWLSAHRPARVPGPFW